MRCRYRSIIIRILFIIIEKVWYIFIKFNNIDESFWNKLDLYCDTTEIAVADAMHLAFALESGCNILVSRDKDFRITADDFIIATAPEEIDIALKKLPQKRGNMIILKTFQASDQQQPRNCAN